MHSGALKVTNFDKSIAFNIQNDSLIRALKVYGQTRAMAVYTSDPLEPL